MSLRLRYYLAILPLFAGLGLINSVLVYYTERNELRWGLQERAQHQSAQQERGLFALLRDQA